MESPKANPDQFGLEGEEIIGAWSQDGSTFDGFFPVIIRDDGDYVLVGKWRERTREEVYRQIDLAEKYDGHISPTYIANYCQYIGIELDEFFKVVERWK